MTDKIWHKTWWLLVSFTYNVHPNQAIRADTTSYPVKCEHLPNMWLSTLKSAQRSFAPLQKLRRNHPFYFISSIVGAKAFWYSEKIPSVPIVSLTQPRISLRMNTKPFPDFWVYFKFTGYCHVTVALQPMYFRHIFGGSRMIVCFCSCLQ